MITVTPELLGLMFLCGLIGLIYGYIVAYSYLHGVRVHTSGPTKTEQLRKKFKKEDVTD